MTKIEQMDELILKVQKDEELQKEIAAILQNESPEDAAAADKWLADNGYSFNLTDLIEHLEDGISLSDNQLEAVAGGNRNLPKDSARGGGKYGIVAIGVTYVPMCRPFE